METITNIQNLDISFLASELAKQLTRERLRLLTKQDLCELLGVSPKTVDDYRKAGLIEATKAGKEYKFTQEEFQNLKRRIDGKDVSSYGKMCDLTRKLKQSGTF